MNAADPPDSGPDQDAEAEYWEQPRRLAEWHTLTPAERELAWARLRHWVAWLHDRYELSIEERLPHCWAEHPGLIEELWALKAWREEIYEAADPSGQAARYWHAELRQTIHAALTFYAAGCRSGHRAGTPATGQLQQRWAQADPLAGIPPRLLAAHTHQPPADSDLFRTDATMQRELRRGLAQPLSDTIGDCVHHDGSWWTAAEAGWLRVTETRLAEVRTDSAAKLAQADTHVAKRNKIRTLLNDDTTHNDAIQNEAPANDAAPRDAISDGPTRDDGTTREGS